MSKERICKNCEYRKPVPGNADAISFCKHEKLSDYMGQPDEFCQDALLYEFSEGGEFIVGDYFGCVHFKEKVSSGAGVIGV